MRGFKKFSTTIHRLKKYTDSVYHIHDIACKQLPVGVVVRLLAFSLYR